MAPFTATYGVRDDQVVSALLSHLQRHDGRFRGQGYMARRRRAKALQSAQGVLEWWKEQGFRTYGRSTGTVEEVASMRAEASSFLAGWFVRVLVAVFAPIAMRWIESLVVGLLTDWLASSASRDYRVAALGGWSQ